ncbi:MAG: HAD hydrolase-like protein [Acidimicrobiia bacterium]|nr:HAD hydrolase-like protein [Acidimicrobiia bacterium]
MSVNWAYLDLDGTLTDPYEGISKSLLHSLEPWGITFDEDSLRRLVGPPLRDTYGTLGLAPDDAELAVERFRERYDVVGWAENRVFDGIPEALGALRAAGLRLGIATSKPTGIARRIAEHFGLAGHLEFVAGASLDASRDAKADVIAWAQTEFGAGDGWMVGDRSHDIVGGRAMGLATIGVTWGFGDRAELADAGADHIVDAVGDLAAFLTS